MVDPKHCVYQRHFSSKIYRNPTNAELFLSEKPVCYSALRAEVRLKDHVNGVKIKYPQLLDRRQKNPQ